MNVREDYVIGPLNEWIGSLFTRENIDQTVAALMASQDPSSEAQRQRQRVRKRLEETETRLRRHQAAIEAGVNPAALVDVINEAESARAAAQAELESMPEPEVRTDAEIYVVIDSLGDVGAALDGAKPERLSTLYESLRLELRYQPHEGTVLVVASPRVVSACVRGASCTLTTRLYLDVRQGTRASRRSIKSLTQAFSQDR